MRHYEVNTIHHMNHLQHKMAVVQAVSMEVALQMVLGCQMTDIYEMTKVPLMIANQTMQKCLYINDEQEVLILIKIVAQ